MKSLSECAESQPLTLPAPMRRLAENSRYVSYNSFVDQIAFDGMRKHLLHDFERIDHIDLHGNVRKNPKLSGTTHNVFGIQVGVGITLAIKKSGVARRLRYHRIPEMARKTEKLEFLTKGEVTWQTLTPDAQSWIVPKNADEYAEFPVLTELFDLRIPRGTIWLRTS